MLELTPHKNFTCLKAYDNSLAFFNLTRLINKITMCVHIRISITPEATFILHFKSN